jgi:hypothetical protein
MIDFRKFVLENIEGLHDASVKYNQVIAKSIFGDMTKVSEIPAPVGDYTVGTNFTVDPKDKQIYTRLFPVTPPKGEVDTDEVGTKGSGNGEIALYWLLSKKYAVKDMRGNDNPDLLIDNKIGIEVKAYDSKKIGLGRFGNQGSNRKLLSVVFGLKALLDAFTPGQKPSKRPPSLDTFNKDELIKSFELLLGFENNTELKQIAHKYSPLESIYQQINSVITGLDLPQGQFTAVQGAAAMLKLLLKTKLQKKPGFGGYIANVTPEGNCSFYLVDETKINELKPETILDNVNANGATLIVNPHEIFA